VDTQLSELLQTIHKEGIEKTTIECEALISEAKATALKTIQKAEEKAASILQRVEKESALLQANVVSALKHAGRDLFLDIEQKIKKLFENLILRQVEELRKTESQETLKKVVERWVSTYGAIELHLSEQEVKVLGDLFLNELVELFSEKIVIKTSKHLKDGFQVWKKDQSVFVDFSSIHIAQLLTQYLNPTFQKYLHEEEH